MWLPGIRADNGTVAENLSCSDTSIILKLQTFGKSLYLSELQFIFDMGRMTVLSNMRTTWNP